MTPRQVALVQQSWQQIQPQADEVAKLFYARLFELDPALRALFKRDMIVQGRMLTSVIHLAVSQLDRLDQLVPTVREMGQRHATYGVRERHYATVGDALLDTLAAGLQSAFTAEVKDAWAATYTVLADTMKSGATEHRPAAKAGYAHPHD
jgi:hemoglobin-like flavoprotein